MVEYARIMKSSLIPEKPLLVYPSLAATLGLDESVMLSALSDIVSQEAGVPSRGDTPYLWYQVTFDQLKEAMPFWDLRDMHRVVTNLREKGVIIVGSAINDHTDTFKFAFNEKREVQTHRAPHIPEQGPAGRNYISSHWQPSEDHLAQLAQHNIPSSFALQQVPEFVTYWRERKEPHRSWGAKFVQQVIRKWRDYETEQASQSQYTPMHKEWQPSIDAWEFMVSHAGINKEFIEDAIPEFIFYWMDRSEKQNNWNRKFYDHVRLQWSRYNSALEHSTDPKPIPDTWQPSNEVYDVLKMANIDAQFAQQQLPEFVIYWRDSNQIHTSWNTRFLQHVKRQWAKRNAMPEGSHSQQPSSTNRSTRDISLEEELSNRSWAN